MADDFPDLDELQARHEAAWTKAFRALWPVALRAARHPAAALNVEDAEEAASDALAYLVPLAKKISSVHELKALVATLAYRNAVSRARHNSAAKRGAKLTVSLESKQEYRQMPHHSLATVASQLTDDELASLTELLRQALAALDEQTRLLLLGNVVHGLTCKELSDKYQMPLGTISAKLSRALKKIRASLRESPGLLQQLKAFLR